MRASAARAVLQLVGLPCLEPPVFDGSLQARLETAADRLLEGDAGALDRLDGARIDFLRWLAEHRDVLFHGSRRADLDVLEPIRLTRDTTAFGDQQAVYATNDPVWAIYFATVRRGKGFSTRNGSLAPAAARGVYPRWYFFSLNPSSETAERFGDGSLYVLPRRGFASQPPLYRAVDSAQWVSAEPVRPLARIAVGAADFPLRDSVVTHTSREPMFVTWARAGLRARRRHPPWH